MMKAIVVNQYGGPNALIPQKMKAPLPATAEVRLQMRAAGVNFSDVYIRRGGGSSYGATLPFVAGREGSGIIESFGEEVEGFAIGDRVAFTGVMGSYAEMCVVPASALIPMPDEMSFEVGASFPLQGMTAHYLLHEFRHLKAGETVLIHAAAGGMGLLLCAWAKHLGMRVIGTVSTEEKAARAKAAGADEIIFYNREDFAPAVMKSTTVEGAHLIIDGVGKTTFKSDLQCAAIRGDIAVYGGASGPAGSLTPADLMPRGLSLHSGTLALFTRTREELLLRADAVLEGWKQGWLDFSPAHIFDLEDAAKAHELLESRASSGKIVLRIG
ncbi:NADPH2:quinone reductase [Abditibacterium utsteinense]|uniref:NADPH2:quinone reductase n=1 Tax=Abditibacterium utsteinense TaxID=1960156 RepID=A0A2S8SXE4_9BACT|nr:quinone oxidoreductase [Abditibacterium utsteinense]PQV65438.1 NADPH2:quinone reductase [Abditibacterium utsteinense]